MKEIIIDDINEDLSEEIYIKKIIKQLEDLPEDELNNEELLENLPKKRGRKPSSKTYWTLETDNSVFNFINEIDDKKRELIFKENIHKPLSKLIDAMIFKLSGIVKPMSAEQDINTLRAICFEKFFKITMPNSEYIKSEKGRPFNFLTSVIRNHLIGYVNEIYKRKNKLEINSLDEVDYSFKEKVNHLGENNYTEIIMEDEIVDSSAIYKKVLKLIQNDLKNDKFTSKKEKEFVQHLLYVMEHINKFNELEFYNKFFIKLILQELTGLPRYTVNYYLSKIGKKYLLLAYKN